MTGNINTKINFGAGPAALPQEVLQQASEAILNYKASGLSILEIPHRGKLFESVLEESKSLVKELCELNDDYEVLWLQGGGRLQFCMIPMNFLGEHETAGYIDSGHWSASAIETAKYYGRTSVLASSRETNYDRLPPWPKDIPKDLSYLHFTTNNTIYGTQWKEIPKTDVPLIADMSSDILSKKTNYQNCSVFYAAVQKNIGPAGATLVVLRKDMCDRIKRTLPEMLDYKAQVKSNSLLNTPPVFAIYVSMLTLRWTKAKTIAAIEEESIAKTKLLYDEIDRNSLFHGVVEKESRSRMNVCFRGKDETTEKAFVQFCETENITGVKGHRSVGGFRVSLYNPVPLDHVKTLVDVMKAFEQKNFQ